MHYRGTKAGYPCKRCNGQVLYGSCLACGWEDQSKEPEPPKIILNGELEDDEEFFRNKRLRKDLD